MTFINGVRVELIKAVIQQRLNRLSEDIKEIAHLMRQYGGEGSTLSYRANLLEDESERVKKWSKLLETEGK